MVFWGVMSNSFQAEMSGKEAQMSEKTNMEYRELEGRRAKVEAVELEIQKKYANISDTERRISWKEDGAVSKERSLKMKEDQLESKMRDITEIALKLKRDQAEVAYFRDNFTNESNKIESERKDLAYLASYVNNQKDLMESEKSGMNNLRGALDGLRKDYLQKIKNDSLSTNYGEFDVKTLYDKKFATGSRDHSPHKTKFASNIFCRLKIRD